MKAPKKHSAFTLVELLVVIAIISLLVAVLTPVLGKAKEQSRRVLCAANQGSIGLAIATYAADNNGWAPACHVYSTYCPYLISWVGGSTRYFSNDGLLYTDTLVHPTTPQPSYDRQYVSESSLYYCPSRDTFNSTNNEWWEMNPTYTGYTRSDYWYYTGEPNCFWVGKNWSDRRLMDVISDGKPIRAEQACYNNNIAHTVEGHRAFNVLYPDGSVTFYVDSDEYITDLIDSNGGYLSVSGTYQMWDHLAQQR